VPTNRQHIDSEYRGRKLTPASQAELEKMGYVFQENGVVRRPALHATRKGGQMVPLELDEAGRIHISEGPESIGEMQTRIRGSLSKSQGTTFDKLVKGAGSKQRVVLVEGSADTGVTWAQVLTKARRAELRALAIKNGVPGADIDRMIDALVTKAGTLKVVSGTRPVRAAFDYVGEYADAYGTPRSGVEIHHGDPLYLGGGHDPAYLIGLRGKPHDAVHDFFDKLTLPSGPFGGSPLQASTLQARAAPALRPTAAVVDVTTGAVTYTRLGK